MNKNKDVVIPDRVCQTSKKLFVTVNPESACKLRLSGHLWLSFLDRTQPGVVVFSIISFPIYINLVT